MDASPPDDSMATIAPARIKLNAARRSVIVKAPVGQVYEQWSRVEDLPKFITPLRNVQRMDDTRFSYTWSGSRQGDEQRGIFQILLRIPSRRIVWGSMSNGLMSGVVCFEPRPHQETEITLKVRSIFEPSSLSRRVKEYLGNFKRLVENGKAA
jgi:uncharacterized membrane protein